MTVSALGLSERPPASHWLHGQDRVWGEVNCYADLWIEVCHALGADPVPGLAYTLGAGFDGDQWTFIKPYAQDLELLYRLDVHEINPYRPLVDTVVDHLAGGRLVTVEVDSWFLPDTAGVSYGLEHVKTTIVPETVDVAARRLHYFHGAGYHELVGTDFDGVLRTGVHEGAGSLSPYVELVQLRGNPVLADDELVDRTVQVARAHLARRPSDDPLSALGDRLGGDLPWLAAEGLEAFHRYAFATCRQCGATAELAADLAAWLGARGFPDMKEAVPSFRDVAASAKSLQFTLARAARGRSVDVRPVIDEMSRGWTAAVSVVERSLGA